MMPKKKKYGTKAIRKKFPVAGYISLKSKRDLEALVETGEYGSVSDFVSEAVLEKIFRHRQEEERRQAAKVTLE